MSRRHRRQQRRHERGTEPVRRLSLGEFRELRVRTIWHGGKPMVDIREWRRSPSDRSRDPYCPTAHGLVIPLSAAHDVSAMIRHTLVTATQSSDGPPSSASSDSNLQAADRDARSPREGSA